LLEASNCAMVLTIRTHLVILFQANQYWPFDLACCHLRIVTSPVGCADCFYIHGVLGKHVYMCQPPFFLSYLSLAFSSPHQDYLWS
jgi:hypothetical protein